MNNPFGIFSAHEISDAINLIPNTVGYLNSINLLPVAPLYSSVAIVEIADGVLNVLPIQPRGGPSSVAKVHTRRAKGFPVPQIPHDDHVSPDDVDGLRRFGTRNREALMSLLSDRLATARAKHDTTLEYMRFGALKGLILDHEGSTLYDLYSEFGVTQKTINYQLNVATTNVLKHSLDAVRHIEATLVGDRKTGVEALVSPGFFDALVGHEKVQKAYASWQEAQNRTGGDMRSGFTYGGITYREVADQIGGVPLIEDGKGHIYPVGTTSTFRTYVAPGDFNDAIGAPGQIYYARVEPSKHQRGYDIHTQSNPLPMCLRPGVLIEISAS